MNNFKEYTDTELETKLDSLMNEDEVSVGDVFVITFENKSLFTREVLEINPIRKTMKTMTRDFVTNEILGCDYNVSISLTERDNWIKQ